MQQPWMTHAWSALGVEETPGGRADARILAYYRDVGHDRVVDDAVPWCAAFLGACLERAGVGSTRSLLARSYLAWGVAADAEPGAIAVLTRGSDPGAGHVGFLLAETEETVILLGGNQSDSVSVAAFDRARVLGFRRPAPISVEAPATQIELDGGEDVTFAAALAHVLEMEGGFTNDPHDPGGPTNKGITLATLAAVKGIALSADSEAVLLAELRRLPDAMARQIYRDRYWAPSRAAEMPAGVDLIHFDAAVNHGRAGAARILQQAVGVPVDSEIGPITLRAVTSADARSLVGRYAALRRARYRELPHFWRFGRGWLNRVDATEARALERVATTPPTPQSKGAPMTETRNTTATMPKSDGKWWGQSMTVWGTLITALSTVLPVLGPVLGLDLTPDLVREVGEHVIRVIQAVGGLLGVLMAIVGRARANTPLVRREVRVQI